MRVRSASCFDKKEETLSISINFPFKVVYMKARIKLQRKIISRNFLSKLFKKKVGTGEVESLAKRNVFGSDKAANVIRNKMVEKEVVRILRLRIQVADRQIKEYEHVLRVENFRKNAMMEEESRMWIASGIENPYRWMANMLREIECDEMRIQWEEGKNWKNSRVDWLEKKYSFGRKGDKLLGDKGVLISDEEIEAF